MRLAPFLLPLLATSHAPTRAAILANPGLAKKYNIPIALVSAAQSAAQNVATQLASSPQAPVVGSAAPLASSTQIKVGLSSVTMSGKGGCQKMRIKGVDFLDQYTGVGTETQGQLLLSISLNPNDGDLAGSRLTEFTNTFCKYKFNEIMIIAAPATPATVPGSMSAYIDCDPADPVPLNGIGALQKAASAEGNGTWNCWETGAITCPTIGNDAELYVDAGGSDVRLTSPGNFNLVADGPQGTAAAGYPLTLLYIAYDVTLDIPMLGSSGGEYRGTMFAVECVTGGTSTSSIWSNAATPVFPAFFNNSMGLTPVWNSATAVWSVALPAGVYKCVVTYTATASTNFLEMSYTSGPPGVVITNSHGNSTSSSGKFLSCIVTVSDAAVAAGANQIAPYCSGTETSVVNACWTIVPYVQLTALAKQGDLKLITDNVGRVVAGKTLQDYERWIDFFAKDYFERKAEKEGSVVPWAPVIDPKTTPGAGDDQSPPPLKSSDLSGSDAATTARKAAAAAKAANDDLAKALEAMRTAGSNEQRANVSLADALRRL